MKPIDGLSFQLYSARAIAPLEHQFELLAGLGYRRVEPFGGLLDDPQHLKALLDRHGMTAPTCHVGMDRLRADAKAVTRTCKDLGMQTIFAPAPLLAERGGGAAEWRALGQELAQLGKAVNAEGLAFGWHNHNWEYQKTADGRSISTSCSPKHQTSSGRRISPGSRAAAPIRRPSCGATAIASSPVTSRTSRRPGNASTRMDGPIRAMACSTGRRCAPR